MQSKKATDKIHALTVAEVSGFERMSKPNTIHKKIKEMETQGYVGDGVKSGRANTYYITDKGLGIIKEVIR
jgi:hypothetical protein